MLTITDQLESVKYYPKNEIHLFLAPASSRLISPIREAHPSRKQYHTDTPSISTMATASPPCTSHTKSFLSNPNGAVGSWLLLHLEILAFRWSDKSSVALHDIAHRFCRALQALHASCVVDTDGVEMPHIDLFVVDASCNTEDMICDRRIEATLQGTKCNAMRTVSNRNFDCTMFAALVTTA